MQTGNWVRLRIINDQMNQAFPQAKGVQVMVEEVNFIGSRATRYGVRLHTDTQSYGFYFIIEDFLGACIDEFTWRLHQNVEALKERITSCDESC